jgi:murein DD-endopeptidase MepM/ murein hydrolase activator NlpD
VSRKTFAALAAALGVVATVLALVARPDTGWFKRSSGSANVAPTAEMAPTPEALAPRVKSVELQRGDSLVRALVREGVDRTVSHAIATALAKSGVNLRRVQTRHTLEITWGADGTATAVRYDPNAWLGFVATANGRGWDVHRMETRPDVRVVAVKGEVRSSLFDAIDAAGESPQLVLEMVEIFSSDFDFTADTRSGDRFRLLVEKRYAGDTFVDYGRIQVAQYLSDGRLLTGIGYERAGAKHQFYDPDGRSLRKSFLKSPLEFTRITSGFTYARPHPILGGTRPHLAIDYAAPVGTPVRAVADGRVTAAGWSGGNGISVTIRHRSGYETMYNHLSKLGAGIRAGARVTQRQVIGLVGATGLATGPHLDYRVSRNGSFVNPLNEKFIPGEPIPAEERATFLQYARTLTTRLLAEAEF